MTKRYGRDDYGTRIELSKRRRTCPRCFKKHRWPTEDKLCRRCEGEWTEEWLEMNTPDKPILVTPFGQDDNRFVVWDEPYPAGDTDVNVQMKLRVVDAVKVQKAITTRFIDAKRGFFYKSDQQALDDFVAVHWATIVEDKL